MLDIGVDIVLWLQSLGNWLVMPMRILSFLGTEEFYLLVAPVILWCVDTGLGMRVGLLLMISGGINDAVKVVLHAPRPYWYNGGVTAFSAETSFGIPSGHAQNAVSVWGALANGVKRRWAWIAAVAVMVLIGVSRVYLGMHFPSDVLAGWLIGAALLWAFIKLEPAVMAWARRQSVAGRLLASFAASLALIGAGALARLSLGSWTMPAEWVSKALAAQPGVEPAPLALSGLISNAGTLFGLAAGGIWLARRGGLDVRGAWWQMLLRYGVGALGVLLLWRGLDMVFPDGENVVAYIFRYIRYGLIGLWVSGLGPIVFVVLRLGKKAHQAT